MVSLIINTLCYWLTKWWDVKIILGTETILKVTIIGHLLQPLAFILVYVPIIHFSSPNYRGCALIFSKLAGTFNSIHHWFILDFIQLHSLLISASIRHFFFVWFNAVILFRQLNKYKQKERGGIGRNIHLLRSILSSINLRITQPPL